MVIKIYVMMEAKTDLKHQKSSSDHSISKTLAKYCENCSGHGFQYWVADVSVFEKLLWVAVVLFFFTSGAVMVNEAESHWRGNPSAVEITTFSKKATDVIHPAITICNPNGYDVGEYLRAVFDNFEYSNLSESEQLRSHFPGYSDVNSDLVSFEKHKFNSFQHATVKCFKLRT